jgi:hypothetical protein
MAERFAATGLYENVTEISDHRFVRTNFKAVHCDNKRAIRYCPCGQIALENNGGVDALNDKGAICTLAPLQLLWKPQSAALVLG